MKIKLIPFKEELITPTRAHYNDAGIDCYAQEDFILCGGKMVKIDLGFGLEIPNGYVGLIMPRSSMNAKGIITQLGVIDSGYNGEIKAVFINTQLFESFEFNKGDKLCQIVILPIAICDLVLELGEERGTGGFGSTGK